MMWMMMAAACLAAGEPPKPLCNNRAATDEFLPTMTMSVRRGEDRLAGTLTMGAKGQPMLLLLPGSGPTDRDGNNAMGVKGGVYRQLGEALKAHGIGSLRIDKRGIGESKIAGDPNAVTVADYVADTQAWRDLLTAHGTRCVWLAGHSEGGLLALASALDRPQGLCGLVLIAAPGRRMDAILKSQLQPKLPAAMWTPTAAAIDRLARGERVDVTTVPAPLHNLFAPQVQGYLIDMMKHDPAAMAAKVGLPILIVQGEEDLQVTVEDARALAAAQPRARLMLLDGTNHVLKTVAKGDAAANAASYADERAIDPRVARAIADFIRDQR